MTDDEMNRFFHSIVEPDGCWHVFDFTPTTDRRRVRVFCEKCGDYCGTFATEEDFKSADANPAYTQSLDLIALVEAEAKRQGLGDKYIRALCDEVEKTFTPEFANNMSEYECGLATATANAPTRARALMSLPWEGEG